MTADGKIAGRSRRQIRISSAEDLERVQSLRASSDAILVGVGTILSDDPHLTVKGATPAKTPLRIVLDSKGRTPDRAKVLDGRTPTLIVTANESSRKWIGAEVLRCGNGRVDLHALLPELYKRGVKTLLVEGGGEVIWSFFSEDLVDRYCVFVGSMVIGGRTSPTPIDGDGFSDDRLLAIRLVDVRKLGDGVLLSYEVARDG